MSNSQHFLKSGGVGEWLKPAVLKTVSQQWLVGSNPTASANIQLIEFASY